MNNRVYLAAKLAHMGAWDRLHALVAARTDFAEPGEGSAYDWKGHRSALAIAWRHADETGLGAAATVERQAHYALIHCSLQPTAARAEPDVLLAFVRQHVPGWTPAGLLRYAPQVANERSRAYLLGRLAQDLPAELFPDALRAVQQIQTVEHRGYALEGMAQHLPAEFLESALAIAYDLAEPYPRLGAFLALLPRLPGPTAADVASAAWSAVHSLDYRYSRTHFFARLYRFMPPPLASQALDEALRAAADAEDGILRLRSSSLADVAAYLTPERMPKARRIARTIGDPEQRAGALRVLARHAPEALQEELRTAALTAAWAISDPVERGLALVDLARELPAGRQEALLDQAFPCLLTPLRSVDEIVHGGWRLVHLAGQLPPLYNRQFLAHLGQVFERAIELCQGTQDKWLAAPIIRSLLGGFPPGLPRQLCLPAVDLALLAKDEGTVERVWPDLAPRLDAELQARALTGIRAIPDGYLRATAFRHVAFCALPEVTPLALEIAQGLPEEGTALIERVGVLTRLLPRALPELRERIAGEALGLVIALRDQHGWSGSAGFLCDLAPYLSPGLVRQAVLDALLSTEAPQNPVTEASPLVRLADHLSSPLRERVLGEALRATGMIGGAFSAGELLAGLAPYLPADLKAKALEAAARAARAQPCLYPLYNPWQAIPSGLAEFMPRELMAQAIADTRRLPDLLDHRCRRADDLGNLAPCLPRALMSQALDAICALPITDWSGSPRGHALKAFAPYLPAELMPDVLALVGTLPETPRDEWADSPRLATLAACAPYLPATLAAECVEIAGSFSAPAYRAMALIAIFPHLPVHLRTELEPQLEGALRSLRPEPSAYAQALISLLPHWPPERRDRAAADAWAAVGAFHQRSVACEERSLYFAGYVSMLVNLAPYLPATLGQEAIAAALAFVRHAPERASVGEALSNLVDDLPDGLTPDLLGEALAVAHGLGDEQCRVLAVSGLVARLAPGVRGHEAVRALAAARATRQPDLRALFLARLLPVLPTTLQATALAEGVDAIHRATRDLTRSGRDHKTRDRALQTLAQSWAAAARPVSFALWTKTIHILATQPRPEVLADLRRLIPVLLALGGPGAAAGLAQAVWDIEARWP